MWDVPSDATVAATTTTVSRVSPVDVFYVPSFLRDEGGSETAEPPRTVGLAPGTRQCLAAIPEATDIPSATA